MNKKVKIVLLLLTIFLPCMLVFSACSTEGNSIATSISVELNTTEYSVSNNTITTTYGKEISLLPSDFNVTLNYDDSSSKKLTSGDYIFISSLPTDTITPVGEYTIVFSYKDLESVNINIKVNKATVDISEIKKTYSKPFVYNGEEHSVGVTNVPTGVTVTYEGTTKAIDAGTYTTKVNFTYLDTINYNAIPSMLISWEIEKANVTGFDNVQLNENEFIYNGKQHNVTVVNIPVGAKIESVTNSSATNADEYISVVKLVCKDTKNYSSFEPVTKEFKWKIWPAPLTVTANDATITYGDNPKSNGYTVTGFVNDETTAILKGSIEYLFNSYFAGNNAGEYKNAIVPTGLYADNYQIIFKAGTLYVEQQTIDVSSVAWPTQTDYIYTGNSIKPVLVAVPQNVEAVYTYSNVNPVEINAYSVTVTLNPKNDNYILINNTIVSSFYFNIIADPTIKPEEPTNVFPNGVYFDITLPGDITIGLNEFEFINNTYYVTINDVNLESVTNAFGNILIDYISTDLDGATYESVEGTIDDIFAPFAIGCDYDDTTECYVGILNITLNDGTICYVRIILNV